MESRRRGRAARGIGCAVAAVVLLVACVAGPVRADQVRNAMAPVLDALGVPRAWRLTRGAGVTVAVLDSGVDGAQADLAGSVTQGPDYTEGANPPGTLPRRVHGTNMASIIAGHGHGPGDADGVTGVAPEARLLSVRVILERDEPGFTVFTREPRFAGTIAAGIRYAVDHGADVLNLSLGRSYPTRAEREAVAYALAHGTVVVAAAGNNGEDTRTPGPSRPACAPSPVQPHSAARPSGSVRLSGAEEMERSGCSVRAATKFTYPASFPGVISVAAVDANGRHAGFSNRNSAVVVSAPGVRIIGAGPGGQYWVGDGTSPATAFVSGVAALIRARHPHLAPALVEQAITTGTQHRPKRGYDTGVGFGRVDAYAALVASDALAGHHGSDFGLPAGRHFAAGSSEPVMVVHRSTAVVVTTITTAALAALGMFAAIPILLRRRRETVWPED
ncbi:Thermophilic serine proteinase precursor [Actinomadura rubteroloni]|uniref:Thermophilic serine proteinase n=1 Tax=Actinomadura rubteroloni TaxID=1926885 RepID=A0A2P4UIH2_9ACTN|nr:S8 family serine peptidase [Actinomadura rubteroloni]POM24836.1 Thermophilic serine proteinase precursor [Actinomadura rubteroloni]